MVKSVCIKAALARGLFACGVMSISCAQAAINLDILTACADMAQLYEYLKARPVPSSNTCRAANGPIETVLLERTRVDASSFCFMQAAPVPSLKGFTCVRTLESASLASLVCFRSASISDIKLYKEQYGQKFAEPVSNYLSAAAACHASNGDTSQAERLSLPWLLSLVSRFDFGFVTLLGKKRLSDSEVVHGYATTDPSIQGATPSALEFVYVTVDNPRYSPDAQRKKAGDWVVLIDDSKGANDFINQEWRKRGAPLTIDMTHYTLERRTTVSVAQDTKLALIKRLQTAIAESLEEEGYEAISDDDIMAKTGKSTTETLGEVTKRMPFGTRDAPRGTLGPTMLILLNERRPRCTKDGAGAMSAFLASGQPIPQVASDYGSVGLMLLSMGACARSTTASTRTYIRGIIDEATEKLLKTLQMN